MQASHSFLWKRRNQIRPQSIQAAHPLACLREPLAPTFTRTATSPISYPVSRALCNSLILIVKIWTSEMPSFYNKYFRSCPPCSSRSFSFSPHSIPSLLSFVLLSLRRAPLSFTSLFYIKTLLVKQITLTVYLLLLPSAVFIHSFFDTLQRRPASLSVLLLSV